jgi:hypothetical protein
MKKGKQKLTLEELAKSQGYKSREDKLANFKFRGPNKGYIPITERNIQYHQ